MSAAKPIAALLLASAALASWWSPRPADAQVRRCVAADGGTIFTDRKCSEVGGSPQPARSADRNRATAVRSGCARSVRALMQEMQHAIDARDTNRLAGLYHWPGMSHAGGYQVLQRLDTVAQRPLVNITAQRPAQSVVAAQQRGFSGWTSARDIPTAPRQLPPTSLRLDQTGANGAGASQTVFSLHRHLGCWWVSL
ncbi:hypothetical protein LDO26_04490 [Luteimonas sp. BDR2-5]|uniref:hypothetical protein n=1 Tax=Proluteimonas luteida TaxID=2878685 RepID=UPI001E32E12D|nr:hypothetical protein [Luteimonas sp. BDR2-5]MCD9027472.1 hypothetical protein [Luteimonas sp. BDR2-5]